MVRNWLVMTETCSSWLFRDHEPRNTDSTSVRKTTAPEDSTVTYGMVMIVVIDFDDGPYWELDIDFSCSSLFRTEGLCTDFIPSGLRDNRQNIDCPWELDEHWFLDICLRQQTESEEHLITRKFEWYCHAKKDRQGDVPKDCTWRSEHSHWRIVMSDVFPNRKSLVTRRDSDMWSQHIIKTERERRFRISARLNLAHGFEIRPSLSDDRVLLEEHLFQHWISKQIWRILQSRTKEEQ